MHLDQVLRLAAGAVDDVVDVLGGAFGEIGDHEADVEAQRGRLDAGASPALGVPGPGFVAGLGIAAQRGLMVEGTAGADVVCSFLDETLQHPIAGQSEDVIDTVALAPCHDLGPAIVAVAADQDAGGGPAGADAPEEATQMAADLLPRRGPAWTQDDGDRTPGLGVPRVRLRRPEDRLQRGSAESSARRDGR